MLAKAPSLILCVVKKSVMLHQSLERPRWHFCSSVVVLNSLLLHVSPQNVLCVICIWHYQDYSTAFIMCLLLLTWLYYVSVARDQASRNSGQPKKLSYDWHCTWNRHLCRSSTCIVVPTLLLRYLFYVNYWLIWTSWYFPNLLAYWLLKIGFLLLFILFCLLTSTLFDKVTDKLHYTSISSYCGIR